ncbi:MAG: GNAT family N-acetyltransferase [Halanaeroarchaeum sp.]
MDVHLRPAEPGDLGSLTDLWVELVDGQRTYGAHLEGEANRQPASDVIAQYVHADGLWVATDRADGDHLVGFVMFHVERGMYEQDVVRGIVENLYVVDSYRDHGVGSRLMSVAESALQDRGASIVGLSVLTGNERARRFYRDRGYHPHRTTMERRIDDNAGERTEDRSTNTGDGQ